MTGQRGRRKALPTLQMIRRSWTQGTIRQRLRRRRLSLCGRIVVDTPILVSDSLDQGVSLRSGVAEMLMHNALSRPFLSLLLEPGNRIARSLSRPSGGGILYA